MAFYCNPININYRYQFNMDQRQNGLKICREAADPSMIEFKGKYYIFASMTLGYWVSEDLVHWKNERLPKELPLYDYAPDVRVMGDYVYFCASKRGEVCDRYRTKDIEHGPYECIKGNFDYWDPNLFIDDDGRVYFYWGCSNSSPIYGVELDPETMLPIGEKLELIHGNPFEHGFERVGENNSRLPRSEEEIEAMFQGYLMNSKVPVDQIPKEYIPLIKGMFSDRPYIEGAWMDKHNGKYYLQYAFAGTQYNTYGDGVYVSDSPLGPFELAKSNPYSYKPGGFIPGAGHGSTMEDKMGNLWHTATMRISKNHDFERRVGLWPAGYDKDGELFCNQRFGDWPIEIPESGVISDPWTKPKWMLLSYHKAVTASSYMEGREPEKLADENVQTWWRAQSNSLEEWVMMDLGKEYDVRAIQINFADDQIQIASPGEIRGTTQARYIEEADTCTRYLLEGSLDGKAFFVIEDKTQACTDLTHDFLLREGGMKVRYIRVSHMEVPYAQNPCISGLRVFGVERGHLCGQADYTVERTSDIDMEIHIDGEDREIPVGYSIVWGYAKDKLYHNCMSFEKNLKIGALMKGQSLYVRVDSFNESGVTEGKLTFVK